MFLETNPATLNNAPDFFPEPIIQLPVVANIENSEVAIIDSAPAEVSLASDNNQRSLVVPTNSVVLQEPKRELKLELLDQMYHSKTVQSYDLYSWDSIFDSTCYYSSIKSLGWTLFPVRIQNLNSNFCRWLN